MTVRLGAIFALVVFAVVVLATSAHSAATEHHVDGGTVFVAVKAIERLPCKGDPDGHLPDEPVPDGTTKQWSWDSSYSSGPNGEATNNVAPECGEDYVQLTSPGLWSITTTHEEDSMTAHCGNDPCVFWSDDPGYPDSTTTTTNYVATRCPGLGIKSLVGRDGLPRDPSTIGLKAPAIDLGDTASADEDVEVSLDNGERFRLDKGASLTVSNCDRLKERAPTLKVRAGRVWTTITKHLGGGHVDPSLWTDHSTAGSRGTRYWLSYVPGTKTTKVHVFAGTVWIANRHGRRHRLYLHKGQTGVQRGDAAPRRVAH